MNTRLNIVILYGGRSVEHEISVRSAKNVVENIDRKRFAVHLIGIDKQGSWFFHENMSENIGEG